MKPTSGYVATSLQMLKWSIRCRGIVATVLAIVAKVASKFGPDWTVSTWLYNCCERQFDARFNIETSGIIPVEKLDMDSERKKVAVRYEPTAPAFFWSIVSNLGINYQDYVFVDFGSGKGRVLLMASEFPFKNIQGIELSRSLHDAAEENIRQYRSRTQECKQIRSTWMDATSYGFPQYPVVVFFYNPFKGEVLTQVLDNLKTSFDLRPRHLIVIYINAEEEEVFNNTDFLSPVISKKTPAGLSWNVYEVFPLGGTSPCGAG